MSKNLNYSIVCAVVKRKTAIGLEKLALPHITTTLLVILLAASWLKFHDDEQLKRGKKHFTTILIV